MTAITALINGNELAVADFPALYTVEDHPGGEAHLALGGAADGRGLVEAGPLVALGLVLELFPEVDVACQGECVAKVCQAVQHLGGVGHGVTEDLPALPETEHSS